jgi:hypothetical protein
LAAVPTVETLLSRIAAGAQCSARQLHRYAAVARLLSHQPKSFPFTQIGVDRFSETEDDASMIVTALI